MTTPPEALTEAQAKYTKARQRTLSVWNTPLEQDAVYSQGNIADELIALQAARIRELEAEVAAAAAALKELLEAADEYSEMPTLDALHALRKIIDEAERTETQALAASADEPTGGVNDGN